MMLDRIKEAAEESVKAKRTNWDKLDVAIEHVGRAITLPGDPAKMPVAKAIEALQRKLKDEEQPVNVVEWFEGYPFDAAVAFSKAMRNLYGWASAVSTPSFFGPQPPTMLSVKTGYRDEDVMLCPMGSFELPGLDNKIKTEITRGPKGRQQFVVHGTFKQGQKYIVLELATEARRILRDESIYRGKAIRIKVDDNGNLDLDQPPEFIDVSQPNILVFDSDVQDKINLNMLAPILHPEECSGVGVPQRRNILLHGPFGCGKSQLMREAARLCEQVHRTFILIDRVSGLKQALEFANFYAPALVSAEDIDRVTEQRDESCNDLVNVIDGVVSKTSRVMTVLTTNFVEKIEQVMLRPGRLDAVIELPRPTFEAVQKLIRVYAGDLLDPNENVDEAAAELSGQIPAAIRECVDRAKLGMIWNRSNYITSRDLVTAAQTMKDHLALLNRPKQDKSAAERLSESLREVLGFNSLPMLERQVDATLYQASKGRDYAESASDGVSEANEKLDEIGARTSTIRKRVTEIHSKIVN